MTDDERRAQLRRRDHLRPTDAAFLIRRDKSTITRWIQQGLPAVRIGNHRYVNRAELLRWAADPDRRTRRRTTAE
ncbi:helix-turn-helix domain-containing protein [Humibacter sp. RRB41]|uniref:helix-turn-helix domain-containing protein n=1 Tax=Humibacter sp. RRB41 TaxID=2919946 RepID=UPI0035AFFCF4